MELTDNDKQRIEQGNPYASFPDVANVYREGYEAATLYERQQQARLIGKLQERLERCRKVSGYSSGFSDIHNEIDFLDLLLNSLKTK